MEGTFAVLFIFGGGATILFSLSPIGRAIADRIRGKGMGGGPADLERMRYLQDSHDSLIEELEAVKHEVVDLQERVDFTERLMTQQRDSQQIAGPSDVQD